MRLHDGGGVDAKVFISEFIIKKFNSPSHTEEAIQNAYGQ